MKRLILFLLASFFLVGCLSGEGDSKDSANFDVKKFTNYSLRIDEDQIDFIDLIESIEVIPLEETDKSLLSRINRIVNNDDQYLVLNNTGQLSTKDQEILFFDKSGNYLYTFNRQGDGPEEYKVIHDFWVSDDTLTIYERSRSILFRYLINGTFVSSKKLPFQVGHIMSHKDQYVVEFNYNTINDTSMYKFGVLNKELNLLTAYLKTEELPENMVWSNEPSVIPYHEGMLLWRMYSDSLYFYNSGELEPLAYFDFGNDWYWEGREMFKAEDYEIIPESNKVWDFVVSLNDDFIYVRAVVAFSHFEHFIIDRRTNEVVRIGLNKSPDAVIQPSNLGWEDEKWVISLTADDALFLIDQLDKSQIKNSLHLKRLDASENPALVKVKIKPSRLWGK